MKYLIYSLLFLLFLSGCVTKENFSSNSVLAVVKISLESDIEDISYSSGVIIASELIKGNKQKITILTAAHAVADDNDDMVSRLSRTITTRPEDEVMKNNILLLLKLEKPRLVVLFPVSDIIVDTPAIILKHNDILDIALIQITIPSKVPVHVAKIVGLSHLMVGQRLWNCGYSASVGKILNRGIFSGYRYNSPANNKDFSLNKAEALYSGTVYLGNSGGGIFNDDGQLVGIVTGAYIGRLGMISSSFVPIDKNVIKKLKK